MSTENAKPQLRLGEYVTLMALMTSLVALSIDAMLPALPAIGADLGVVRTNDNQWVIGLLFLGLAIGQMIYGPMSDSVGRKPAIYAGLALFMIGCFLSLFATTFSTMLIGRFLQGIGAAGPRIVVIALIRDQYQGRAMAQIMSFVMAVFILVPALAPALGQIIVMIADWRAIFASFLLLAVMVSVWFAIRQPETLLVDRRAPFSFKRLRQAIVETCTHRIALGYTLTAGLIFGAFIGFLNLAQPILQAQYGLGAQFPLYFAILALSIGCASYFNARLVMRYGMRRLSRMALWVLSGLAVAAVMAAYPSAGHPPLWGFMAYLICSFFCLGMLFSNFNALAMEPLGHIAGSAAAVIASLTTLISLALGAAIGQSYNGSVLPLISGFAILGIASIVVMQWTERNA